MKSIVFKCMLLLLLIVSDKCISIQEKAGRLEKKISIEKSIKKTKMKGFKENLANFFRGVASVILTGDAVVCASETNAVGSLQISDDITRLNGVSEVDDQRGDN